MRPKNRSAKPHLSMSTINDPPEYIWKKYDMEFGPANMVELWCPQTGDFLKFGAGQLGRQGGIDKEEFETFTAFKTWKQKMHENLERQKEDQNHRNHYRQYSLKSIHVNTVTRFPNGKVGFVKMDAWVQREPLQGKGTAARNPDGSIDYADTLYETVFLRGGSVAILMILRPTDTSQEQWVILTEQPRVPACSLQFVEIPAGIIDDEENFAGPAAKEIEQGTGLKVPRSELINMTELALRSPDSAQENGKQKDREKLEAAMYASPGGCDEFISLFVWEKDMNREQMKALRGEIDGLRNTGEQIILRLEKYSDLWKIGARDAKTLGAWALYEGLKNSGALQQVQKQRTSESEGKPESQLASKPATQSPSKPATQSPSKPATQPVIQSEVQPGSQPELQQQTGRLRSAWAAIFRKTRASH